MGKTERSKWAGAHESTGKRTSFNPLSPCHAVASAKADDCGLLLKRSDMA